MIRREAIEHTQTSTSEGTRQNGQSLRGGVCDGPAARRLQSPPWRRSRM